MEFVGYTCPECDTYHPTVSGTRTRDGEIQVKCPACHTVERFRGVRKAIA